MRSRFAFLLLAVATAALLAASCADPAGGPPAASLSRPGTIADTWRWDAGGSRGFLYSSYAGQAAAGTRPPF